MIDRIDQQDFFIGGRFVRPHGTERVEVRIAAATNVLVVQPIYRRWYESLVGFEQLPHALVEQWIAATTEGKPQLIGGWRRRDAR